MNNETHIPDDDLVLFALQLLPQDRMQAVREHILACESCRTETAHLQGDLVAYAMTAEVTAPPAEARERLLRQVAKEPKLAPAPEPIPLATPVRGRSEPVFPTRQSRIFSAESSEEEEEKVRQRPRRAPWVLAWTGWAVAAGCSFLAGLQLHQRQQIQRTADMQEARLTQTTQHATHAQDALDTLTATNAQQVALHLQPTAATKNATKGSTEAVTTQALAAYIATKGSLVFVATHLEPVAPGKTYELWLLPANGAAPIPAGTFKPDAQGSASVVMPNLPKGVQAKGFGVTIENVGGSATPTLPIIMAGT